MNKTKIVLASVFLALTNHLAHAGGSSGSHGGDAVVCYNEDFVKKRNPNHSWDSSAPAWIYVPADGANIISADLEDYIEYSEQSTYPIALGAATLPYPTKVETILRRIDQFDSIFGQFVRDGVKSTKPAFASRSQIPELNDANYTVLYKPNCGVTQAAVQAPPAQPGLARVRIDKDLWDRFSSDHKAGLTIHEALYYAYIKLFEEKNSDRVRYLNFVLATEMDKLSPDEFQDAMKSAGLNFTLLLRPFLGKDINWKLNLPGIPKDALTVLEPHPYVNLNHKTVTNAVSLNYTAPPSNECGTSEHAGYFRDLVAPPNVELGFETSSSNCYGFYSVKNLSAGSSVSGYIANSFWSHEGFGQFQLDVDSGSASVSQKEKHYDYVIHVQGESNQAGKAVLQNSKLKIDFEGSLMDVNSPPEGGWTVNQPDGQLTFSIPGLPKKAVLRMPPEKFSTFVHISENSIEMYGNEWPVEILKDDGGVEHRTIHVRHLYESETVFIRTSNGWEQVK